MTRVTDKQLRALVRLSRTKGGREFIRDHGRAIIDLMFGPPLPEITIDRPLRKRQLSGKNTTLVITDEKGIGK